MNTQRRTELTVYRSRWIWAVLLPALSACGEPKSTYARYCGKCRRDMSMRHILNQERKTLFWGGLSIIP